MADIIMGPENMTKVHKHKKQQIEKQDLEELGVPNDDNLQLKQERRHKKHQTQLQDNTDSTSSNSTATLAFGSEPNFKEALEEAQKFQKQFATADAIPDDQIPAEFDWRKVKGVDFTNPVRDQSSCGGCHAFSFVQVIEMRLKLKYGKTIPSLSAQSLISCNYLNEGCNGGYSILHGFFSENSYLVDDTCVPYAQSQISCSQFEKCPPIAKVKSSSVIGGGYGGATEKKMMKELIRNGAINVDLASRSEAQGAAGGDKIRSSASAADAKSQGAISDTNLKDYGYVWQKTGHSAVVIGYGGKDGEKFWILRNSYGESDGTKGDSKIRRGRNDEVIETFVAVFDPVLCGGEETC